MNKKIYVELIKGKVNGFALFTLYRLHQEVQVND